MKRILLSLAAGTILTCTFIACGQSGQQNGQEQAKATEAALTANLSQFSSSSTTDNPTLFLSLVKATPTDSSVIYLAKSLNGSDTLSLQLEVNKTIPAGLFADGTLNEEDAFTKGTLKFSRVDEGSDRLVAAMATLYQQPASARMSAEPLEPLVFSSNKTVVDLSGNGSFAFKLSFENPEEQPAEAFAELNLYNRSLKLWAKDTAQYVGLLSAFVGE